MAESWPGVRAPCFDFEGAAQCADSTRTTACDLGTSSSAISPRSRVIRSPSDVHAYGRKLERPSSVARLNTTQAQILRIRLRFQAGPGYNPPDNARARG